jgi:hypothetical protein
LFAPLPLGVHECGYIHVPTFPPVLMAVVHFALQIEDVDRNGSLNLREMTAICGKRSSGHISSICIGGRSSGKAARGAEEMEKRDLDGDGEVSLQEMVSTTTVVSYPHGFCSRGKPRVF